MRTVLSLSAASLAVIALTGCGSSMTPEMQGLSLTHKEVPVQRQVVNNQNWRSVSDDLARAFLLDQPSHLSPYPITATSGMPR